MRIAFSVLFLFISVQCRAQRLLIEQNHTKGYEQYAIVANMVNEQLFKDSIDRKSFQYSFKCRQSDAELKQISGKFKRLYPGITYGLPAITLPATEISDTMWYRQTYFSVDKRKHIKFLMQVKVTFVGNDPAGEMYFPYIDDIQVLGPDEIMEKHPKALLPYLTKKRK
ncbi:MAG: hypothetical protein H0X33_13995 [Taibaiella sp.]|nr:hypothetical protein [Taibaiella sp.]